MSNSDVKRRFEKQRKRYLEAFSNYESAVTLICSLQAWFEYRWGTSGRIEAGLLQSFNRFPEADGLTPDFEVRFHTPYVIWGDHKRTIQPASRGRNESVQQILRYASRRPPSLCLPATVTDCRREARAQLITPGYDVVVLVNAANDDVAAEAIDAARASLGSTHSNGQAGEHEEEGQSAGVASPAPIVVLGYHLDRERIRGEWYIVKWRAHHGNCRFSTPNVSKSAIEEDLNALITDATHCPIPVSRPALGLAGRHPLINDIPPAIYTAILLVVPAINALLTDDEQDQLQSSGKIEKAVTKEDVLASDPIKSMDPQPSGLRKWIEAALELLVNELKRARKTAETHPQEYVVTIDNALIEGDLKELFSERAARTAAKLAARSSRRDRSRRSFPGQMDLFP